MKRFSGSSAELEKLRADVERALGYPRRPDVVGENVKNPVDTVHAFGIEIDENSVAELVTDDDILAIASDTRLSAALRKRLAQKLAEAKNG